MEFDGGRMDVVWGCDEMLLGAIATGANAAIGSTYNIAAPLYQRIIDAFESADLAEARHLQSLSVNMIRILARYPFHSAMKVVLGFRGFEMGPCRLPQDRVSAEQEVSLRSDLESIGFFEWAENNTQTRAS
jgi:N-acetylneuraminate lyase